jgi:hypothetical protein
VTAREQVSPGAAVPLLAGRSAINESMRKFLTGSRVEQGNLPAWLNRLMRQAGVSTIDEIPDPVLKQQVVSGIEQELAAQ